MPTSRGVRGEEYAGSPARFDQAVAMNAMGLFGLHLITPAATGGRRWVQEDGGDYKAFFVEDGLLKGYILVGDCLENAGVYTALIRERTPLSAVDFGLLRQHPPVRGFFPGEAPGDVRMTREGSRNDKHFR